MSAKTTNCGWCGALAAMEPVPEATYVTGQVIRFGPGNRSEAQVAWSMYRCPGCHSAMLAQVAVDGFQDEMVIGWYPKKPPLRSYPDSVPVQITKAAQEAHSSLSVGNGQAAVLMARTTIEAAAKKKGIARGSLVQKIDALYDQHLVYEHVRDAAHEIRHVGNDAAHGDLAEVPITDEEAAEVLELMDMVLDGVFVAPAKTSAVKAARLQRQTVKAAESSQVGDGSALMPERMP